MTKDRAMIQNFYSHLKAKIDAVKDNLQRPLTLTEKILYAHLAQGHVNKNLKSFQRGETYVHFSPDRVAMQDATAQMALLQFMSAGIKQVSVPSTVHCDHLIQAEINAPKDLSRAQLENKEVYDFLSSVSKKYGIGFWHPGAGIIHQVVLENYAFPGGLIIGTDSHTPNAGGLGMLAIGVGGADAVDVMAGIPWELKFPKIIGVKLKGKISGWTSPKDVILKLAGILTVKGGTGYVVEYFGDGAESLSCTGKSTICNMGAEIGATTSIFPFDESMIRYLNHTERSDVAALSKDLASYLKADNEVYTNPNSFYDKVIEIDLNTLEPHINGPFTPDLATPISKFAKTVRDKGWPKELRAALIGSCTNSSYEDIDRVASIAKQALEKKLKVHSDFLITPGSERVRSTIERDGQLEMLEKIGGTVMANACGPCIGQWKRHDVKEGDKNSIVTSFNRNFTARNDGNPQTHAFVASPETVIGLALCGDLLTDFTTQELVNEDGEKIKLLPPEGSELPQKGFVAESFGFSPPSHDGQNINVVIKDDSTRLQKLTPFSAPRIKDDFSNLKLLIKVKGKCTTDHISMAGKWLKFRGHLDNISDNLLIGAVNAFNDKVNSVKNELSQSYESVPATARAYKKEGFGWIVVGEENYGEGSSREHAALEPRYLGCKAVITKSFARIHETNLKKQGVLPLNFKNPLDYEKIQEDDVFNLNLDNLAPKVDVTLDVNHADGGKDSLILTHTLNEQQIEWFYAGSALNLIASQNKN